VAWEVTNLLTTILVIEDAWIPHGKFRGEGRISLHESLGPGLTRLLELQVTTDEPVETVVENAFLILRVVASTDAWRVFARMRVQFDACSVPRPSVETVTAQSLQ